MTYENIIDLQHAIENGELNTETISAFDCKGELFIQNEKGERLFSAYYRSHNACDDVCALLGLDEPEQV